MIPHRPMSPWWEDAPVYHHQPATFRCEHPGTGWVGPDAATGDPRLTPDGDIARRGTIPDYVTYAVVHPGHLTSVPQ